MMYKLKTTILYLALLSTVATAQTLFVGGGAGYSAFTDDFSSAPTVKARIGLISYSGISVDVTGEYLQANGQTSTDADLKMIPVSLGGTFIVKNDSNAWPYIGAEAGLAWMSDGFDTKNLFYGAKAGVLLKVGHDLAIFSEAAYKSIADDTSGLTVTPLQGTIGMMFMFGDSQPRRTTKVVNKKVVNKKVIKKNRRRNKNKKRIPNRYR